MFERRLRRMSSFFKLQLTKIILTIVKQTMKYEYIDY